ncbi:helix-turn-helix domain protein [Streptococcus oralis]|nr:helix-turn-helix domain protein [Streptococcus oralis]
MDRSLVMIEKMALGEFYKELRLARKLKQSDVACDGLTASQLSKFELEQFSCYTFFIS